MTIRLAGCVLLDEYGKILLLHRSTPGRTQWELPGGKLEPEETPDEAAVRELDEELGIGVRLTGLLGIGAFEQGENDYEYTWFQAEVIRADPQLQETETFDDLDYFDVEDMPSLALSANMEVLLEQIISGEVVLGA